MNRYSDICGVMSQELQHVVGIDADPSALQIASQRLQGHLKDQRLSLVDGNFE